MESSTPKILKITIDLSEDSKATILVKQNDDPVQVAKSFLAAHSLDPSLQGNLVKLIQTQQKSLKKPNSVTPQKSSTKSHISKSSSLTTLAGRILKHSYRYSEASRLTSTKVNYGQVLYEKGIEFKESLRQSSEKRFKEKENLLQSHSFHPVISKNSEEIARSSETTKRIKRSQELIKKLESDKEENEMKECYFTPMISKRSDKHSRKNIFNELYQEAHEKRKRSHDFMNHTEKSSFFKGPTEKKKLDVEDLVDRLANSRFKTEEEIERMRYQAEQNIDKNTGQKFFTPIICKQPGSRYEKRNVWEDLYYYSQQNKKLDNETEKTLNLTSEKTGKIFDNFRKHRFEGVFKKLDSDNDGKISFDKISIEGFDRETIVIMSPVLMDIESSKQEVGLGEFLGMMEGLYSKLGTHEKMVIMKAQNEEPDQSFSFKPKINERSKHMASSPHLGANIYDRTKAAKEIKEMKTKKINEMKAAGSFLKVSKG